MVRVLLLYFLILYFRIILKIVIVIVAVLILFFLLQIPEQEWKYVTKDCTSKSRAMEAQLNYFIDKIASVLKV